MHLGCCDECTTIAVPVPGPPGPPGAPGGGTASYVHTQAVASAIWHVTHNLGQMIVDGTTVFSDNWQTQWSNVIVEPLSPNDCNLYFGAPITGVALIQK